VAEGVVDLLEAVQVNKEEGHLPGSALVCALFVKEDVEYLGQLATIAKAGQFIGIGLAVALFGDHAKPPC